MSYATSVGGRAGPLGWIKEAAAAFGARAARALARRTDVSELTDAQLADIGVERAAIAPPRPTIEVDGRLMRRLLSMR